MTPKSDRDDLEEAADEAFDLLDAGRPVDGADDEIETSIEQETPTAGGNEVDGGTELEFDEDRDVDEPDVRSACRFCQTEFRTVVAERRHHSEDHCEEAPKFRSDGRPLIDPQVHELRANFLFEPLGDVLRIGQDGMAPYFAIVSQWDRCLMDETGQDDVGAFDSAGDTWILNHEDNKTSYRDEEAKIKTLPVTPATPTTSM